MSGGNITTGVQFPFGATNVGTKTRWPTGGAAGARAAKLIITTF